MDPKVFKPASTFELLKREKFYDLIVVVGPEKEKIKCHQLFLKANSPVFEAMLDERWQKQGQGQGDCKNNGDDAYNYTKSTEETAVEKITTETEILENQELENIEENTKFINNYDAVQLQLSVAALQEFEILSISPSTFRTFLMFIYDQVNPRVHLTSAYGDTLPISELLDLLSFAHYYQVPSLFNECNAVLLTCQLQMDSVLDTYHAACLYSLASLKAKTAAYISIIFSKLIMDPVFLSVDEQFLLDFLPSDELEVKEFKLFNAVLSWSCAKLNSSDPAPSDRRFLLKNILPLIRFPTIDSDLFQGRVVPTQILTASEIQMIIKSRKRRRCNDTDAKNGDSGISNLKLQFNTKPRSTNLGYVLSFVRDGIESTALTMESVFYTPLVLDKPTRMKFQVDRCITLYGFEFYGPDSSDFWNVSIRICDWRNSSNVKGQVNKKVYANKCKKFYVSFETQIDIKSKYAKNKKDVPWYLVETRVSGPGRLLQMNLNGEDTRLGKFAFRSRSKNVKYDFVGLDPRVAGLRFGPPCRLPK